MFDRLLKFTGVRLDTERLLRELGRKGVRPVRPAPGAGDILSALNRAGFTPRRDK